MAVATRVDDVAIYSVVSHPPSHSSAPNIVLVHGLGLSHCHIYVPDQPGFGGSGHPEDVPDIAGLADALAEWTRNFGLCDATFVGNSEGCQIIAQLAVRHPKLVSAAVLQGPTAHPGSARGSGSLSAGARTGATTRLLWTPSPGGSTRRPGICACCAHFGIR